MIFAQFSHAQCLNKYDTLSPTICAGDTFYFNGIPHTRSTTLGGFRTVSDTVMLASGCDSITFLKLTVLRVARDSFNQSICTGNTYTFFGQTLRSAGVYRDTIVNGSAYGCDSFVIVNLTIGGAVTNNTYANICRGDSLLFAGTYLKTAGVYNDTVVSGVACDSIVVLHLTYTPQPTTVLTQPYCAGTPYVFNGVTLTAPGIYYDTIHGGASNGCDSLVRLNYQATVIRVTRRDTICYADTLFIPGGYYILGSAGSGRYAPDTVSYGCIDTAYTFIITVDSPATPLISAAGLVLSETVTGFTSYQWQLGSSSLGTQATYTATQNGSYTVVATDARGCSAVSSPYVVTGVGIMGVSGDLHTGVYPNPNTGTFVLESSNAIGAEAVIYDMLGHIAARTTIAKDKMNLDLDLSRGIYLLKLKDNSGKVNTVTFTIAK
jgi:hypothetical protein